MESALGKRIAQLRKDKNLKQDELAEMLLRIMVDSSEGDKVRVNLPVALVQLALDMGMEMPQVFSQSSDHGTNESIKSALNCIDLRQIMELVHHGAIGNIVEVESSEGDTVRIFVE